MPGKVKPRIEVRGEKSFVKGVSLMGFNRDGNPSVVDVSKGRIIRIRPLRFDWKYDKKKFNLWKMEARGQSFEPGLKTLLPPFGLAYKKRVYSPNRILYPLKRVDWDPRGSRNVENRGKSGKYGPEAILSQSDGHGEGKSIHIAHGCANKLLALLGGYTLQMRNPDSWEGWAWGAKHAWGMEPVGEMKPAANLITRYL
jgi:hypothetical protein